MQSDAISCLGVFALRCTAVCRRFVGLLGSFGGALFQHRLGRFPLGFPLPIHAFSHAVALLPGALLLCFQAKPAAQRFPAGIVNHEHYAVRITRGFIWSDHTRELCAGMQLTLLE